MRCLYPILFTGKTMRKPGKNPCSLSPIRLAEIFVRHCMSWCWPGRGGGAERKAGSIALQSYCRCPSPAPRRSPGGRGASGGRCGQALSFATFSFRCHNFLKTLNCGRQPLWIKVRAMVGAILWLLSPRRTCSPMSNPKPPISLDL